MHKLLFLVVIICLPLAGKRDLAAEAAEAFRLSVLSHDEFNRLVMMYMQAHERLHPVTRAVLARNLIIDPSTTPPSWKLRQATSERE